MEDYIQTHVQEAPNLGYGDTIVRFATLSCEVFEKFRDLCYVREDSGKWRKYVSQAWVDLLTWEAAAWWIQDDGCKQAGAMSISTHSFSKEECDRLAQWLTDHGVEAKSHLTLKKSTGSSYWIITIGVDAAAVLAEKIRPFMHPSLLYKIEGVGRKELPKLVCLYCGSEYYGHSHTPLRPCCKKRKCRKRKKAETNTASRIKIAGSAEAYVKMKYHERRARQTPDQIATENKRGNSRYHERLRTEPGFKEKMLQQKRARKAKRTPEQVAEEYRKKEERRKELMQDPVYYANWLTKRRAYMAKKRAKASS